jgi:4-hydroxy-4-methyl-2-oxoglutarate aldolase
MSKYAKDDNQISGPALRELFRGMDTASLCDINKDLRFMSPDVKPLLRGTRVLGRARTVSVLDDILSVISALRDAQPGEVLVIASRGGQKALFGELFSAEAKRKGLEGIICDGACRDSDSIREMAFPVFTRLVSPMAGSCDKIFDTQQNITCGGILVKPGDIVFGDNDGVVVLSEQELNILPAAKNIQTVEAQVLESLKKGTPLFSMTNADEHLAAIADGMKSTLSFRVEEQTDFS